MTLYAESTNVPIDRSQAEVRSVLNAQGCTKFALVEDGPRTMIRAVLTKGGGSVQLQFIVTMPGRKEERFTHYRTRGGWKRPRADGAAEQAWMQECRRRWRCLVVMLRAKFAAVESGIATFQDEFLANLVLPSGETVGDWAARDIAPAIAEGRMPTRLLLGAGA